jgi:hypothetical protein
MRRSRHAYGFAGFRTQFQTLRLRAAFHHLLCLSKLIPLDDGIADFTFTP